ncbi:MAG TPA: YaiI/YqxD family protein [Gemmatimonadetes bacterium]|nr:YaiI/YqxD family protein [Gemmatimonadota bacterium]
MTDIFIDADACPVKEEVYRVAKRYGLRVVLVANSWLRAPNEEWIELVIVGGELDAADAWIVDHISPGDIVISADIPLAALCLEKGAGVLGPRGRPFTADSIGNALATRELMSQLREMGEAGGGPPPFEKRDRSQFLQALDQMIHSIRLKRG